MRDEFLIERQGKTFVLFAGLLDEAHRRGLRSIDTEIIRTPAKLPGNDDTAIVKATVLMEEVDQESGEVVKKTFTGIGDASPKNVGGQVKNAVPRMAETRAKARALRDAVNVGTTALEEISGEPEDGERFSSRGTPGEGFPGEQRRRNQSSSGSRANAGRSSKKAPRARVAHPARKSRIDLLKTLAVEARGEDGVERLEKKIGKALTELSQAEADEWIDRLTPEDE